jgi:EmrB/QacA subfamily drug resistance transporter
VSQSLTELFVENISPLRKWGTLIVLSLALAIIIIDTTLLNVSISNIIRDLSTNIQSIQWVIAGYSLTLAALTITGGRLGDLFGRKRMFMLGAVIFAIGSFITSISQSIPQMMAGEAIVEGIGAALMMPATASLLVTTFKGRERAMAFGIWGAIAGSAAAIGPVLGGYLTTNYSWRWGFRINVVVAAILLLGSIIINESRDTKDKPSLDWIGVLLSAAGLFSFVFGIIEASKYGWWKAKEIFTIGAHSFAMPGSLSIVPFAVLVGVVILVLFYLWERAVTNKGNTPLVSLDLFSNRQFTSGFTTTACISLGMSGLIFSLPVFFQAVRGLDAFHTGLALLPMSLTLLVAAPLSAFLSHKIAPRYLIQVGTVVSIIATLVLRNTFTTEASAASFIPGLILYGFGLGLVMSLVNNVTLSAVPAHEAGEASGLNNTFRQIGSSLGAAILGAVLLTALSSNLSSGVQASSVIPANQKDLIAQAVSARSSEVEFGQAGSGTSQLPPTISTEITTISKQATVDANKSALAYSIIFSVLTLGVTFWLPKGKSDELQHKEEAVAAH